MEELVGKSVAEAEEAQRAEDRKAAQKRRRFQLVLTGAALIGILAGIWLTLPHTPAKAVSADEAAIEGDWELKSVNGLPVGQKAESVIIGQQVHFHEGKLHGETRIIANTDAGTSAMPFPDESVTEVKAGVGNNEVLVIWNGTYFTLPNHIVEMHIGKATYRVTMHADPERETLNMEQDAILTYRGPASYHVASLPPVTKTAQIP